MTAAATPRITPLSVAVVAAFIRVFVGIRVCWGVRGVVVCLEEGEVMVMKGVLLREREVCMDEGCVKERGKERYCWRAGVMSRNDGEEEEELLVWMVFFLKKAHLLLRVIVVREGMSVCEDRVIGNTLQSDGTRTPECTTAVNTVFNGSECCEFRQVYSSIHLIITTSHDQFS